MEDSAAAPPPPPSFALRHIRPCSAGRRASSASAASPSVPPAAATAYTTEVLLHVGAPPSASSVTPTAPSASYMCPAYLLQAGCPRLREMLADAFESTVTDASTGRAAAAVAAAVAVAGGGGDGAAGDWAASPSSSAGTPVTVPLPFLAPDTFEAVAAYVEHFYAFDCTDASDPNAARRLSSSSPSSASALPLRGPSVLQRPLHLPDLYALTEWEHHYVLTELLGIESGLVTSLRLAEQGAWVDLVSGSTTTTAATGAGPLPGKEDSQRSACFAMPRRRRMWARVRRVLEAATRLEMPALRRLCAAVAANMLTDLTARDVARLVHASEEASAAAAAAAADGPVVTADARTQLLKRLPWLARP